MIDQYNKFELYDGLKVNGDYTLKENIADNGAIKEAYYAYLKYTKNFGEELLLPGLKYTQKQLFWISAAMVRIPNYLMIKMIPVFCSHLIMW